MYNEKIKALHGSRGMTLVELLVVMVILSVVMMAVMSLFIPIKRSTVTQTQVSDVNSNLRLALNTMTRDLLTAGFLATKYPIVFPDADTAPNYGSMSLTDIGTTNPTEFIIRSRVVGSGFARIRSASYAASTLSLTVSDSNMLSKFPVGSKVRIFTYSGDEVIDGTNESDRVVTVTSNTTNIDVNVAASDLLYPVISLKEIVVIRVKDGSQTSLQTIHYKLKDGALERIVNDSKQLLARNLDSVFFHYTGSPVINRVDVTLTGKTSSEDKIREVETSVKLRNIVNL